MKMRRAAFDALNGQRFDILACLKDVELDVTEVCRATGFKWHTTRYHLVVLRENGFVEEVAVRKRNHSSRAMNETRPTTRYRLKKLGFEALDYFPYEGREARKLLHVSRLRKGVE